MIKYFVTSVVFSYTLFASSINWSDNYHMSRQKAKKENKNVLLFISSKTNPFCEYMEVDMFTNKDIIIAINQDYIAVKLYVEDGNFPGGLRFYSAPSIYFLNAKGKFFEKKYKRIIGEISKYKMINILEDLKPKKSIL